MKPAIVGAAAALGALISGCATTPPTPPAPPKVSTEVQVNINFDTQQSSGSHKSLERAAVSGVPQHVGFYYSVNPDCTSGGLVQTRMTTAPAHGSVAFVQKDGFSSFPAGSAAFACNTKKNPGIEVVYTAAPDFVGSDQFTVVGIGPKGKYMETHYTVKVLPPVSAK
jgi:hypothetical protein